MATAKVWRVVRSLSFGSGDMGRRPVPVGGGFRGWGDVKGMDAARFIAAHNSGHQIWQYMLYTYKFRRHPVLRSRWRRMLSVYLAAMWLRATGGR